jgi:hypothetical protein
MVGNFHIGSGDLGRVYGGVGPEGEMIAIKMVNGVDCVKLEKEWQMYLALSKSGLEGSVIPRCFGLYKYRDFTMLVTEFAGVRLPDKNTLGQKDRQVISLRFTLYFPFNCKRYLGSK